MFAFMGSKLSDVLDDPAHDVETNANANANATPVRIDRNRMQASLTSGSKVIPNGLTREQKRQFILSNAR